MLGGKVRTSPLFWRLVGIATGDIEYDGRGVANKNAKVLTLFHRYAMWVFGYRAVKRRGRRIRVLGRVSSILEQAVRECKHGELLKDDECFWQFVTGLYEADGWATIHCKKENGRVYPKVGLGLSPDEELLARALVRRLRDYGIEARLEWHGELNVILAPSSSYELHEFLKNPVVRNPMRPESFEGTRTKPGTVET